MEEQYKKTFDQMVDSLKMYQRYELKDKNRKDILDKVYVDPIENDGILNLCLKDNTTVLIGRRGTGKSTIFMRMQNELRKQNDIMTCYIDVKSIFDVAKRNYITINYLKTSNLEEIEQYSIQRQFILDFVDELINEICKNYDTIWEKFKQKLHISKSQKAIDKLKNIRNQILFIRLRNGISCSNGMSPHPLTPNEILKIAAVTHAILFLIYCPLSVMHRDHTHPIVGTGTGLEESNTDCASNRSERSSGL